MNHSSRPKLSEHNQEKLLDAVLSRATCSPNLDERPPNHPVTSSTQAATPPQPSKRHIDTSDVDPFPAKKARLGLGEKHAGLGGDERAELATKTKLQQPTPTPTKWHASFLQDFVPPLDSYPGPGFHNTFVSRWLESVYPLGRETHCKSDSHLHRPATRGISRQATTSAPAMGGTRAADGFAAPPAPASIGGGTWVSSLTGPNAPSDVSLEQTSKKSLVEEHLYRALNLVSNNIYVRSPSDQLPQEIANLVRRVGKDRDSPGPSLNQIRTDKELHELENGAGEFMVENYFRDNEKHAVPDAGSHLKVSTPVPDMLFGYTLDAFAQQRVQLLSMGTSMMANNLGLIYPFFVIEVKGDGPLWVATNQCAGGSTSCVNITERLNQKLRDCQSDRVQLIDSAVFSIAMNGSEARLYFSWKHNELDYYMRKVESFALQRPEHYVEFRKYVRNIIDWGKDARLKGIRDSLDFLLDENRKRLSEAAKARPPPSSSGGSETSSSGKKRRSSAKDVQDQGPVASEA